MQCNKPIPKQAKSLKLEEQKRKVDNLKVH